MNEYYTNLLLQALIDAQESISMAQQHAIKADAPAWLIKNLSRNQAALRGRHDDVLMMMWWQKQDET